MTELSPENRGLVERVLPGALPPTGGLVWSMICAHLDDLLNAARQEAHPPEPAGGDELEGLREAIALASDMLSKHLEQYHDYDCEPHEEPAERKSLRGIMYHLEGSLITDAALSNLRALRAISTPPASQEGEDLERSQGSGCSPSTPRFAREKAQGEP